MGRSAGTAVPMNPYRTRATKARRHGTGSEIQGRPSSLTLTGVALPDEPHHQGGAVATLGGAGEGLDAELVRSGLWQESKGEIWVGRQQAGLECQLARPSTGNS